MATAETLLRASSADLLRAISREDVDAAEEMIREVPLDEFAEWAEDGEQRLLLAPLHLAARLAAGFMMESLLSAGASPTQVDGQGWSALHHLAASTAYGASKAHALQVLQRAGADADALTPSQQTALHLAARSPSTDAEFLSRLVLAARETMACDVVGRTALHYVALAPRAPRPSSPPAVDANGPPPSPTADLAAAAATRLGELADVLLRFAAIDPRDADADGYTAAELAVSRGHRELEAKLREAEARAASSGLCCCCGGAWVQPLVLTLFVVLTNLAAGYYCLPTLPPAWPTIAIAALFASVVGFGLATFLCEPGYLPKNPPPAHSSGARGAAAANGASSPAAIASPGQVAVPLQSPQTPLLAAGGGTPSAGEARSGGGGGVANAGEDAPPLATPQRPTQPHRPETSPAVPRSGQSNSSYCHACRAFKPLRSKHCRTCDRCVSQFDHHCPWLGACIGQRNRVPFYLFVTCLLVDLLSLASLAIVTIVREDDLAHAVAFAAATISALLPPPSMVEEEAAASPPLPPSAPPLPPSAPPPPPTWLCQALPVLCIDTAWLEESSHGMRIALAVLTLFVGLPLLYFWYHRTRNICANLTTNERYNLRRYPHFKRDDGSFVNPFDQGVGKNCTFYFCSTAACCRPAAAAGGGGGLRDRFGHPLMVDIEPGMMSAVKPVESPAAGIASSSVTRRV
jgi:hypothetical protein